MNARLKTLKQLDKFLRQELGIHSSIKIEVFDDNTEGWELRDKTVCASFYSDKKRPLKRFYVCYRSSLNPEMLIETMAHEYVHISDRASGLWTTEQFGDSTFHTWNKRKIIIHDSDRYTTENSFNSPWELKAYREEGPLAKKYKLHIERLKKKDNIVTVLLRSFRTLTFTT